MSQTFRLTEDELCAPGLTNHISLGSNVIIMIVCILINVFIV